MWGQGQGIHNRYGKNLCYPVIDSREMCFLGCNLFGLYGYTLGEIYGRMAIWILILREVRYF